MTDFTRAKANKFVTDTMALVLRMEKRKLSHKVRSIFDSVESKDVTVYIPAIVFSEILYLSESTLIKTKKQVFKNWDPFVFSF